MSAVKDGLADTAVGVGVHRHLKLMAAHVAHCVQGLIAGDRCLGDRLVGEVAVTMRDLREPRVLVPRIVDLQSCSFVQWDIALQRW